MNDEQMKRSRLVLVVACAAVATTSALAGCSDDLAAGAPPFEDASTNPPVVTPPDAGRNPTPDAGPPPEHDASAEVDASTPPDAASDAGGLPQTALSPRVLSSFPQEGASIYAVRMEAATPPATGYGYRQQVSLHFDRPMDVTHRSLMLRGPNDDEVTFSGAWDDTATTLTAEIPLRQLHVPNRGADVLPLTYEATYRIVFPDLRSAAGDGVHTTDGYLQDGALDFTTLPKDGLVDHTCFHTFDDVYQTLALGPTPEDAPSFGSSHTHKRFVVAFQGEAGAPRSGHAKLTVSNPTLRQIMVPDDVAVAMFGPDGTEVESTIITVPVICSLRFNHRFRLTTAGTYTVRFGPSEQPSHEVFFESGSL